MTAQWCVTRKCAIALRLVCMQADEAYRWACSTGNLAAARCLRAQLALPPSREVFAEAVLDAVGSGGRTCAGELGAVVRALRECGCPVGEAEAEDVLRRWGLVVVLQRAGEGARGLGGVGARG